MKKVLPLFIVSLFLFAYQAIGQTDSAFFYGYSKDLIIYVKKLELKKPLVKDAHLLANDTTVLRLANLWCYQTKEGYFQKFQDPASNNALWYKREEKGKINVYSTKITPESFRGNTGYGNNSLQPNTMGMTFGSSNKDYFFETPDKTLLLIEYNNLKPYLEQNPLSLETLEKVRKISSAKNMILASGIGMIMLGGIMSIMRDSEDSETKSINKPLMLFGGITCLIPLALPITSKKYREAITIFNQGQNLKTEADK